MTLINAHKSSIILQNLLFLIVQGMVNELGSSTKTYEEQTKNHQELQTPPNRF